MSNHPTQSQENRGSIVGSESSDSGGGTTASNMYSTWREQAEHVLCGSVLPRELPWLAYDQGQALIIVIVEDFADFVESAASNARNEDSSDQVLALRVLFREAPLQNHPFLYCLWRLCRPRANQRTHDNQQNPRPAAACFRSHLPTKGNQLPHPASPHVATVLCQTSGGSDPEYPSRRSRYREGGWRKSAVPRHGMPYHAPRLDD